MTGPPSRGIPSPKPSPVPAARRGGGSFLGPQWFPRLRQHVRSRPSYPPPQMEPRRHSNRHVEPPRAPHRQRIWRYHPYHHQCPQLDLGEVHLLKLHRPRRVALNYRSPPSPRRAPPFTTTSTTSSNSHGPRHPSTPSLKPSLLLPRRPNSSYASNSPSPAKLLSSHMSRPPLSRLLAPSDGKDSPPNGKKCGWTAESTSRVAGG